MRISTISHALPSRRVTNQELIETVIERSRQFFPSGSLRLLQTGMHRAFKRSGTEIRYHRTNDEKAIHFGLKAGRDALQSAGIQPNEIDLLIYAGVGRGWIEPATANLFQSELQLRRATCFDVLDACASWIRSLCIAQSFIDSGTYKRIMILNCEFNFKEYANFEIRDLDEMRTSFSAFTIGEAATATILTDEGPPNAIHISFRTSGEKHHLCKIPLPHASEFCENGHHSVPPMRFFTQPSELVSFAIQELVSHVKQTNLLSSHRHDLVIGHAVSSTISSVVAKQLGITESVIFETHGRFGNTVSASLPLALSVAEMEGRLKRGMRVMLLMGSAGISTSVCSFEY